MLEIRNLGQFLIEQLVIDISSVEGASGVGWNFDGYVAHKVDRLSPGDTAKIKILTGPADRANITFKVTTTTRGVHHEMEKRLAWDVRQNGFVFRDQ